MRLYPYITRLLVAFITSAMQTSLGSATEIKVLSTHAALEVLRELGPQFEGVACTRFRGR
jgi:hypothetical protein